MHIERVRDAASDAVADYARLTDVTLRSAHEPANGLYIAESAKVIRRAIGAGHRPRSVLMEEKWLPGLEPSLAEFDIPVHLADPEQLEAITGYRVHRGALAAFERPRCATPPHCWRKPGGSSCSRTSWTIPTSVPSSARSRRSAPMRCSSARGAPTRSTGAACA